MSTLQAVKNYYDKCQDDYVIFWDLNKNKAINYGYWDEHARTFSEALKNINKVLSQRINITSSDKVLDAGCGVGGSALWLAKNVGCSVVGINIVEKQIQEAKKLAQEEGLDTLLDFETCDFTNTNFEDESFDVVWALESLPHTPRRDKFLEEASRVLEEEGRIIIADYLSTGKDRSKEEQQIMQNWQEAWAMPDFPTEEKYTQILKEEGFQKVEITDETSHIKPSAQRLNLLSFPGRLFSPLLQLLGVRNERQTVHTKSARLQYLGLKRNLWRYKIISAVKK